jgi:hypothetical protein
MKLNGKPQQKRSVRFLPVFPKQASYKNVPIDAQSLAHYASSIPVDSNRTKRILSPVPSEQSQTNSYTVVSKKDVEFVSHFTTTTGFEPVRANPTDDECFAQFESVALTTRPRCP